MDLASLFKDLSVTCSGEDRNIRCCIHWRGFCGGTIVFCNNAIRTIGQRLIKQCCEGLCMAE